MNKENVNKAIERLEAKAKKQRELVAKLEQKATALRTKMFLDDPAIHAAQAEGYLTGFWWPDAWKHKPGGPWIYEAPAWRNNAEDQLRAKLSQACNDAWRRGWVLGLKDKIRSGRSITVDEMLVWRDKHRRQS